jgi:hypothetical protein
MMRWLIVFAIGCGDGNVAPDATPIDTVDCPGGEIGRVPESRVCFTAAPTYAPRTLPAVIRTDTSELCATDVSRPNACVIVADAFAIGTRVTAVGTRPLVLLARDSITIASALDVRPAGSRACATDFGAGGTLGGRGGTGGGQSPAVSPVSELVGGCAGGLGEAVSAPGGMGGRGGGGVALIATEIVIDGVVDASGSGGHGCGPVTIHGGCGGGGGGSGGMIVLDASATLRGTGIVMANGGGGGSAETTYNMQAPDGETPDEAHPADAARGGVAGDAVQGPPKGAVGGDGGASGMIDGQAGVFVTWGTLVNRRTGGGGGGAGIVRIAGDSSSFAGIVSPPLR